MGVYEFSLIIVTVIFFVFYLNGLTRLYLARRRAESIMPLSRAAGA